MESKIVKRSYRYFDFLLAAMVIAMAVFGIVVIGSATSATLGGDVLDLYGSQKFWVATGIVVMLLASFIDYHFICKFYIVIYAVNLLLLISVLFLGSDDVTGTARWLRFPGFSIQPSEFCKIFMIVFLARYIERFADNINKPYILLPTFAIALLPVLLIARQPSLSAALVVGALSIGILYVGVLSYKYIIPALVLGTPVALGLYIDLHLQKPVLINKILSEYQLRRIMLWINPDESDPKYFQTKQSIRAIGSGLFTGKGLTEGTTEVPLAHNDFIFSIIGEELGFIGCMAVLGLMLVVVLKCLLIAHKAVDTSGRLIATGVGVMLAFQTFVNVGVAIGLLPNTGAPLPFVSYGGSSMWVSMASIGFCINVSMTKPKSLFEGTEDGRLHLMRGV